MKSRDYKTPVLAIGELGLIHCMGTNGVPVYTASEYKPGITSHSRYSLQHFTLSTYSSDTFIDELCEIGDMLKQKAVLMSHDDRVILNMSRHREQLSEHFLLRLPPADLIERLLNKLKFCRLCDETNLPAPLSEEVSDYNSLMQAGERLEPPYLIKPGLRHYWYSPDFARQVGSYQKAYVCNTFNELVVLYSRISNIHPEVVIQEYVSGDDDQMYDVNAHVTDDGSIDGYVICQKLRVYPPVAGWTCYARTVVDEHLLDICKEIIIKLRLTGLLNFQFKKDDRSNEYKLIEIHTRTSILDFQGAAAGQNLPMNYYAALTDSDWERPDLYESGVGYIHLARDLRLLLMSRKEALSHLPAWVKSYKSTRVFDGMIIQDLKVLFLQLYTTFRK